MKTTVFAAAAAALAFGAGPASAADPIFVGHLVDFTGPTSDVGKPYGQGVADAMAWINKNGGIAGQPLKFETVDYSYNAPRAIATYKKWVGTDKAVTIQGWGTADTEVDATWMERFEHPELLGDLQRAVVTEHDAA